MEFRAGGRIRMEADPNQDMKDVQEFCGWSKKRTPGREKSPGEAPEGERVFSVKEENEWVAAREE